MKLARDVLAITENGSCVRSCASLLHGPITWRDDVVLMPETFVTDLGICDYSDCDDEHVHEVLESLTSLVTLVRRPMNELL